MECQSISEIFEIVSEEAAHMTSQNTAFALQRVVHLSQRQQLPRLRHAPEFISLVDSLEQQAEELSAKVKLSVQSSALSSERGGQ